MEVNHLSFRDIAKEIEELGQRRQITADEILNLYQQLSHTVKQQTGKATEECKVGNIGDFARLLAWEGGAFSRIYAANRDAVCEYKAFFAKKLDEMKTEALAGADELKTIELQAKEIEQKCAEADTYRERIAEQAAALEQKKRELAQLQAETDRERAACDALKQELDRMSVPALEEARAEKTMLQQQLAELKRQIGEQDGLQTEQSSIRRQIAEQTRTLEQKKRELEQQKQLADMEQETCDDLTKQVEQLETVDLPSIQSRRAELERQVEQLGLQIAEQTVVCDREAEKKQKAEAERNQLQTETSQLLADTEELLRQTEQLSDKKLAVESDFETKQTELEQLKGGFTRLSAEYQQLLSNIQERKLRNEQFRQGQLAQAQQACAEAEQVLQDMQAEVQKCQSAQESLIKRTDMARAQKSRLLEDCDTMQISAELAEKSREEQQKELDRLAGLKLAAETAQKIAAEDCAALQTRLEEMEKQKAFLLEQKPVLEQRLEAMAISLQNQQAAYEMKQAEAERRQNELSEMNDKQQSELDGLNADIDRLKERSEKLQDSIAEAEKKLKEWESDGEKKQSEFQNLQSTLMDLQNAMASDEYQQQTMRLREIHSRLRFLSSKFRNLSEESAVISAQSGGRITAFDVTADVRAALEETDAKLKQIGERMNEYEKMVKEDLS